MNCELKPFDFSTDSRRRVSFHDLWWRINNNLDKFINLLRLSFSVLLPFVIASMLLATPDLSRCLNVLAAIFSGLSIFGEAILSYFKFRALSEFHYRLKNRFEKNILKFENGQITLPEAIAEHIKIIDTQFKEP